MSDWYTHDSGVPAYLSPGTSALIRAEFDLIEAAFDKLPNYTANGGKILSVNSGGTAVEALYSVIDDDSMATASATTLATSESIKAYADSLIAANNEWYEILANGNVSNGNDVIVSAGDTLTVDTINETTAAAGVTIDSVLLKDGGISAPSDIFLTSNADALRGRNVADNANIWLIGTDASDRVVIDASAFGTLFGGIVRVAGSTIIGSTSVTPEAALHVYTGNSAGTISSNADEFLIEGSAAGIGQTIMGGDTSLMTIQFRGATGLVGTIEAKYSTNTFALGSAKVGASTTLWSGNQIPNLTLSGASGSELATFAGNISVDGDITITTGSITSASGTISFGNENLTIGGNVTMSLNNPIFNMVSSVDADTRLNFYEQLSPTLGGYITYDGSANNYIIGTAENDVDYPVLTMTRGTGNATFAGDVTLSAGDLTLSAGVVTQTGNTNGLFTSSITNSSVGNAAVANYRLVSDSAQLDIYATSAAYTGVASWQDSGVITTSAGTSGGLILNAQVGSFIVQTGLTQRLAINSTGATFAGDVTLAGGSQDYLITDNGQGLVIQSRTTGLGNYIYLFTNDGDTTDPVQFNLYGLGTPGSTSDRERLAIEWSTVNNQYEIYTEANGTGTLRPLVLYTEGNTDQLKLDTSGDVSTSGSLTVTDFLNVGVSTELTIATGAITVTRSRHTVDTESDAASDDLDTISGGSAGTILILSAASDARTVVLKDGTGNLALAGDFSLTNSKDTILLYYDGATWNEISRSDNTA